MALRRPAVYRVHEPPSDQRLQEYRQDVLSHNIPCGNLAQRPEVQKLLQRLNTLPVGPALKIGFLKSLMRARYAVEPLGHYGLSKAKYTHFTSPIRRYADLLVHRALFDDVKSSLPALKEAADPHFHHRAQFIRRGTGQQGHQNVRLPQGAIEIRPAAEVSRLWSSTCATSDFLLTCLPWA